MQPSRGWQARYEATWNPPEQTFLGETAAVRLALPTDNLCHASGPNQSGLLNALWFQPQQLRRIGLGHLHNVRPGDALRHQAFVEGQQPVRMERIVGLTKVG